MGADHLDTLFILIGWSRPSTDPDAKLVVCVDGTETLQQLDTDLQSEQTEIQFKFQTDYDDYGYVNRKVIADAAYLEKAQELYNRCPAVRCM